MAQSQQPNRPPLAQPRTQTLSALNPFGGNGVGVEPVRGGGVVAVEQQRAIAEVVARMTIARANPRDPIMAVEKILNDCCRPSLAERAIYQFARGGTDIRGPSIRLAEAIAQRWGNLSSGIKELSRHGEYSECVAYAWDLETGFYDERQFQVRHWRDTRSGGYLLTDERDIYELIANFGQRRKRAVLLTVIPGDVTEAAVEQCEQTMIQGADVSPEGIRKLLDTFGQLGVTQHQIEARIQRRVDSIRPAQLVNLRKIYLSIQDGMSEPADWFGDAPALQTGETETEQSETESGRASPNPTAGASPAAPRRRGRPPGPSRQQQQEEPSDQGEEIDTAPPTAGPVETGGDATSTESSPGPSNTGDGQPPRRRVNFEV